MSTLGAIIGGVGDVVSGFSQLENQSYMRGMQRQAWAREDNAVQRRVADLRAAGLSPTLAAGGAASSSSPISLKAPDLPVTGALNAVRQQADISQTQAQTDLTNLQAGKVKKETDWIDRQNAVDIQARELANVFSSTTMTDRQKQEFYKVSNEMMNEYLKKFTLEQGNWDYHWYKDKLLPTDFGSSISNVVGGLTRGLMGKFLK